jgi:cobalt-zinc-cadmium efflux system protein
MSSAGHPPAPGCQGAGRRVPGGYGHDGHQHGGSSGPGGGGGGGGGGGHSHRPGPGADARYLVVALALLAAFMAAEVIVAVLSGSLALLSDAGHMLSDVGAIAAALWAIRLAARPASGAWTFGWKRAEILSAAGNGITLLVVSGIITVEAVNRLIHPPVVEGGALIAVAAAGVAVNVTAAWVLARADRGSLNIQGAFRHVLTDLYGFIGTLIAGVVIVATGWTQADAIASLIVVALMLKAAWELLRDSGRVLLEAAPEGMDLEDVRTHLLATDHVHNVHDLHVWTVTSGLPTLSAHIVVDDSCFHDGHAPQLLDALQACLTGHFDVEHSTFQLEAAAHAGHETGTH